MELFAQEQPFNKKLNCVSMPECKVYEIPEENGINMLNNSDSCAFTITELEVWEIIEQ